jgi:hypothetical protein
MGNGHEGKKDKKRLPGWVKAVDLILRSWHIGVTAILFGGVIWKVPLSHLILWHHLAIASGGALMVSGVYQSRHWPYQVRSIMATAHVGLLGLVHARPDLMVPVLTTVLVFGVFGSNMPGYIRNWSLVHGQRVD